MYLCHLRKKIPKSLTRFAFAALICIFVYSLVALRCGSIYGDYNVFRTVKILYCWWKWVSVKHHFYSSYTDPKEEQKWIRALKKEGQPAVTILVKQFYFTKKYKYPLVRSIIVESLGEMGAREAVPDLIVALNDDDQNVRYCAINALGEIHDKSAVPALLERLDKEKEKDDDLFMTTEIVYILGRLGDRKAIPALIKMLRTSPDKYTQDQITFLHQCAIRSLEDITGQRFGNPWPYEPEITRRWIKWWEKQKKKERTVLQETGQNRGD